MNWIDKCIAERAAEARAKESRLREEEVKRERLRRLSESIFLPNKVRILSLVEAANVELARVNEQLGCYYFDDSISFYSVKVQERIDKNNSGFERICGVIPNNQMYISVKDQEKPVLWLSCEGSWTGFHSGPEIQLEDVTKDNLITIMGIISGRLLPAPSAGINWKVCFPNLVRCGFWRRFLVG